MNDEIEKFDDPEATPGVVCKSAEISQHQATEDDLKKINKYTIDNVTAEDVFVFKAVIADNEQDDRNHMPFNMKAIRDMKKLYPGKTMLKDHRRSADNQIARIYDTEIVESEKTTELGENHAELVAKMYMVKTASNADLIAEIKGGIKREVSTGTVANKMICSVCGVDNMKDWCIHYPGREYTLQATGEKRRCKMLLDGVKEAYELSFVAIPAQPRAGTRKDFSDGFAKPVERTKETHIDESKNINDDASMGLTVTIGSAEAFIMSKNFNMEEN